ncbi:MAG: hypothetical protein AB7C96_09850 [Hydrogenovibrio sp.]
MSEKIRYSLFILWYSPIRHFDSKRVSFDTSHQPIAIFSPSAVFFQNPPHYKGAHPACPFNSGYQSPEAIYNRSQPLSQIDCMTNKTRNDWFQKQVYKNFNKIKGVKIF